MQQPYLTGYSSVIRAASKKAEYLRGDISTGNIMFTEAFEGIVNDWDHATKIVIDRACQAYHTVSPSRGYLHFTMLNLF